MNNNELTKATVLAGIETGKYHPLSREVFYLKIPRKEIDAVLPQANFWVGGPFIPGQGDMSDEDIEHMFSEFTKL